MLTLKKLKEMEPDDIISQGLAINSPDGIFMVNHRIGDKLRWVAVRGNTYDWAIYINWSEHSTQDVMRNGAKVDAEMHIKKLVPCDKSAFRMYRH